jgi:mevalonate kinase
MKRLLLTLLLISGCAEYEEPEKQCDFYEDLCGEGSGIDYEICSKGGAVWFEVDERIYYTSNYLLLKECGF